MKAKCPLCDRDKYTATTQLDLHLEHYHLLIEKIHEKIEYLEKSIENDKTLGLDFMSKSYQILCNRKGAIQELKSLLENDKK